MYDRPILTTMNAFSEIPSSRKSRDTFSDRNQTNSAQLWSHDERYTLLFRYFSPFPKFNYVAGYLDNKLPMKVIEIYRQVEDVNDIILNLLLTACARVTSKEVFELVKQIASSLTDSSRSNPFVTTALIDALMKCGDVDASESLFVVQKAEIPHTYGAMMKGFSFLPGQQSNNNHRALRFQVILKMACLEKQSNYFFS